MNIATVSTEQVQYSKLSSVHNPGEQNLLNRLSDQAQSWRTNDKRRDKQKLVQAILFTFTVYSSFFPLPKWNTFLQEIKKIKNKKHQHRFTPILAAFLLLPNFLPVNQ